VGDVTADGNGAPPPAPPDRRAGLAGEGGNNGERALAAVVIQEVAAELERATEMFGSFNSDHEGLGVILEEWHELVEAVRANSPRAIEREAIQVSAMAARLVLDGRARAVAALEAIDNGERPGGDVAPPLQTEQHAVEMRLMITVPHMMRRLQEAGWRNPDFDPEDSDRMACAARDLAEAALERAAEYVDEEIEEQIELMTPRDHGLVRDNGGRTEKHTASGGGAGATTTTAAYGSEPYPADDEREPEDRRSHHE